MSEQVTVAITAPISPAKILQVEKAADKVYFYPDGDIPHDLAREVNIWYTAWTGLPSSITHPEQVPKTRMIQLSSAGANKVLCSQVMTEEAKKRIQVCSASAYLSGIHALSIPQWIIANIVNSRDRQTWPSQGLVKHAAGSFGARYPSNRTIFGKTVGMLGYGHIARETARILRAFNCEIIAANSKGDKRIESGYTIPGTGDLDGDIPTQYYATTDHDSFSAFLSRCDVLVCSLPSTPQTTYMLDASHLSKLPEGAILLNVGRGDLIRSDVILEALDAPGGLCAVALDVTDPEPLPDHHPLYTHPAAIITGHTSGSFEGYYDAGADVLIAQLERLKSGKSFNNVVDPDKGY